MTQKQKKVIVLVGGGSGGPVSPLLAVAAELEEKMPEVRFLFVGTRTGVERRMAHTAGIPFRGIVSARLRRFVSIRNLFIPFQLLVGFIQSYRLLRKVKADLVFGAGGFVQVPVCWAAWVLGVPVCLHQQDVLPSLSNKLCAPTAERITVSFPTSVQDFPHGYILKNLHREDRVVYTGNPVRELTTVARANAHHYFKLDPEYPTLLVLGGGTGALGLNILLDASLPNLTRFLNIIHVTGKGRRVTSEQHKRYKSYEFLDDMGMAYSAADMVLCRAGLSTITELAALKKATVLVPMPHSHQEANALYLAEHEAVLALDQELLTPEGLTTFLRSVLFEKHLLKDMGDRLHKLMPQDATRQVAKILMEVLA